MGMMPFSPSLDAVGSTLEVGNFPVNVEYNAVLIDIESGQQLVEFPDANRDYGFQWFPDKNRLFLPDRLFATGLMPGTRYVTWSPDGTSLAATTRDGSLLVWDLSEFY